MHGFGNVGFKHFGDSKVFEKILEVDFEFEIGRSFRFSSDFYVSLGRNAVVVVGAGRAGAQNRVVVAFGAEKEIGHLRCGERCAERIGIAAGGVGVRRFLVAGQRVPKFDLQPLELRFDHFPRRGGSSESVADLDGNVGGGRSI